MIEPGTDEVTIELLGSFALSIEGRDVQVPLGAQRLLGFLALARGGIHRAVAAEQLWPDSPRSRAGANLRSALWHLRRRGEHVLVTSSGPRLRLAPSVLVDRHRVPDSVQNATTQAGEQDGAALDQLIAALSDGLLVDWSDDWLLVERERWDQVRLHTLETLAQRMLSSGKHLTALRAALTAVAIEPVRESAHRTVVEIFLDEGNTACALKHYQRYRRLVQHELGVTPSSHMTRLVQPLASI